MAFTELSVRESVPADVDKLLALMRGLAVFEGYIDDFRVTRRDILSNGYGDGQTFKAFVVPSPTGDELLGMAITYVIPWTYDLKPVLVLKELFVAEHARGLGVGHELMTAIIAQAASLGASKLQWTVLTNNEKAKAFYRSFGATPDKIWESWLLDASKFNRLS